MISGLAYVDALADEGLSKGELRTQFHHVIDVAPTVLEVAKLPPPAMVNGVTQELQPPPSTLHSKVAGVSVAVNVNGGVASLSGSTRPRSRSLRWTLPCGSSSRWARG